MAKEYCAVCEKKVNSLTKSRAKIKDNAIVCNDCYSAAVSFKEQVKRGNEGFSVDEIKEMKEQKAIAKAEKKEGKNKKEKKSENNIEDKLPSIQENISIIENFDAYHDDPEVKEAIEKMKYQTDTLKERLATENLSEKEIDEIDKELKQYAKGIRQSSFWDGLGTKFESAGERLEKTGKKLTKAGLHTTAAVWTPPLYIGYRLIKKNKKNNKNVSINSPEDHLIAFIKECEQGYKDGKIDEETMKEYIVDFTNKYYRM